MHRPWGRRYLLTEVWLYSVLKAHPEGQEVLAQCLRSDLGHSPWFLLPFALTW